VPHAEKKETIELDGLRGEMCVAELGRREGIAASLYYRWSKDFLEAGKSRLSGDTPRSRRHGQLRIADGYFC
jgi:transposase